MSSTGHRHPFNKITYPGNFQRLFNVFMRTYSFVVTGGAAVFAGRPGRKTAQTQPIRENTSSNGSSSIGRLLFHQ